MAAAQPSTTEDASKSEIKSAVDVPPVTLAQLLVSQQTLFQQLEKRQTETQAKMDALDKKIFQLSP